MKVILLLCLVISCLNTEAQVLRVETSDIPSFFFKVNSDGSMLSYTIPLPGRVDAAPGENKILDLKTGVLVKIPGPNDPVFIGNSGLMVIPGKHLTYRIYRVSDLVKGKFEVLEETDDFIGYYQSAAVMSEKDGVYSIRIIAEYKAHEHPYIDFIYDSKLESSDPKALIRTNLRSSYVCSNINLKLPMLSKDGTHLGGIDVKTGTSGIWKINSDMSCTKTVDLKAKVGKINFDYKNKQIAYHVYHKIGTTGVDASDGYVSRPQKDFVADIFILDLETLTSERITHNRESNSLYPDFTEDGRLVFIDHPHDATKKVSFNFVSLSPVSGR